MIKYLELHTSSGQPILIKLESIRDVLKDTEGYAIINGSVVQESYNEVKQLILNDDRRQAYSHELNIKTRTLMRNSIWQLVKDMGEDRALEFVREVLNCIDYNDIAEVERKYYHDAGGAQDTPV